MAAPEHTSLQVNYKLPDGTLINVYAEEPLDLEVRLGITEDLAGRIAEVGASLRAAFNVAPLTAPEVSNVTPITQAPSSPGVGPACIHGPMVYKEGIGKASNKPYKGWFCQVQGSTCKPQFGN